MGGCSTEAISSVGAALDVVLARSPDAVVGAMGDDGKLVPVPPSVPLSRHRVFEGRSGLDLVVPEDHVRVIDAWRRSAEEPILDVLVRTLGEPDRWSTVHFFDVRAEHGVRMIVLETDDPDLALKAGDARAAQRRRAAHVKRDAAAVFLEVDDAMPGLLGWNADELVGTATLELVHPDDVERAIESWMEMRAGAPSGRLRVRYRHAGGHYVWVEVINENRLDDPDLACIVSEFVDISAEMAELEALHERERLLGRLAEALPIGICHIRPDREVVYSNEPMAALVGPVDDVEGLLAGVAPADRRLVEMAVESALQGQPGALEATVVHGPDERRCELTFRTLTAEDGRVDGLIVCAADVTDRARLRAELERRATHDELSGCLNRAATMVELERALRESAQVVVAYIDLDDFKAVNDECGHAAGDELLRIAAARLRRVTRIEDRIGRIGGDEFVVICPPRLEPIDPDALVRRLRDAICGDVVFADRRIALRASVGAAVSRDGELDCEAVLSRADAAMYAAKRGERQTT